MGGNGTTEVVVEPTTTTRLLENVTSQENTTVLDEMARNSTLPESERIWETTYMVLLPLTITVAVLVTILLIVKTKMNDFVSRLILQFNIAIVLACVFLLVAHEHNMTLYGTVQAYYPYEVARVTGNLVGVVNYFSMAAYFALTVCLCITVVVLRDLVVHGKKHDTITSIIIWVVPLAQVLVIVLEVTVFETPNDYANISILVAYIMIMISLVISIVKSYQLLMLRMGNILGTTCEKLCSIMMLVTTVIMFLRLLAFAVGIYIFSDLIQKYSYIPNAIVLLERIEVLVLVILLFCLKPPNPRKIVRAGKTYTRTEAQEKPPEDNTVPLQQIQE